MPGRIFPPPVPNPIDRAAVDRWSRMYGVGWDGRYDGIGWRGQHSLIDAIMFWLLSMGSLVMLVAGIVALVVWSIGDLGVPSNG